MACTALLQRVVELSEDECSTAAAQQTVNDAAALLDQAGGLLDGLQALAGLPGAGDTTGPERVEAPEEFSEFFESVNGQLGGKMKPLDPDDHEPESEVDEEPPVLQKLIDPVGPHAVLRERPPPLRPKASTTSPSGSASAAERRAERSRDPSADPPPPAPAAPPSATNSAWWTELPDEAEEEHRSERPAPPRTADSDVDLEDGFEETPVPPAAGDGGRHRGLRGYTQSMSLVDLIGFICAQGDDGVLRVTTSAETVELFFEGGHLVLARSNNTPDGHRVGDLLVRHGVISEELLQEVTGRQGATGSSVADALLSEGHVTDEQVRTALEGQAQGLFSRLFQQDNAYFAFSAELPEDTERLIHLNVTHLMLESARLQDEAGAPESSRS